MQKKKCPNLDELDFDATPDAIEDARNECPVVFSYSRAEALAAGELKDAGEMATDAGFKYPVALTKAAWEKCVAVPPFALSESEEGRLWDVLSVLRWFAQGSYSDEMEFAVMVSDQDCGLAEVPLRAVCGAGDDQTPVITVMLRNER